MDGLNTYITQNKDRFIKELFEFLRIPSISARPENKQDMYAAASYLKEMLLSNGADEAQVLETEGHPVIFSSKTINPLLPTILIYGHYDVQPVEPLELWISQPFEPEIREGKIFARGADDDKGQLFMQLKAFESMIKTNTLPCNVKFMIEGEEEIGSVHLKKFCEQHKEMLKSDIILISDTTMIAPDIPSITVGLRGLSYLEVEITGPNRDLHSGLYGGAVANPINELAKMISKLKDNNNRITIPGFYDDVIELDQSERDDMAKAPFNLENYKKSLDISEVTGESGFSTIERTGIRPTLDVCGIWGGYTGEGAKTVLPSKAYAKISMRLVPNQKSKKIDTLFEEYFTSLAPKGIKVKVTSLHGGEGYVSPVDTIAFKAASTAIEKIYHKKPVPVRSGGSIPIVSDFEQVLGVKSILLGFGLDSDAIHSPNENFPLQQFENGILTIPYFYKYFNELSKK